MSDLAAVARDERISGGLRLERDDLQQVSREATADNRRFIAFNGLCIAGAVSGAATKFVEGEGLRSFLMPSGVAAVAIWGLVTQARLRRRRIAEILQAHTLGSYVNYQLGSSGIELQSDAGLTRLAWGECHSFGESAHAFLLYAGRVVPEILYKRAFREDMLTVVREQLRANVKKRPVARAIAIVLIVSLFFLALGIGVGVATRGAPH
jgi:hypothetical protein